MWCYQLIRLTLFGDEVETYITIENSYYTGRCGYNLARQFPVSVITNK